MSFERHGQQFGDRNRLTFDQLQLLEDKISPTARRWVRDIPGLADHGRRTLAYWGEIPPVGEDTP